MIEYDSKEIARCGALLDQCKSCLEEVVLEAGVDMVDTFTANMALLIDNGGASQLLKDIRRSGPTANLMIAYAATVALREALLSIRRQQLEDSP